MDPKDTSQHSTQTRKGSMCVHLVSTVAIKVSLVTSSRRRAVKLPNPSACLELCIQKPRLLLNSTAVCEPRLHLPLAAWPREFTIRSTPRLAPRLINKHEVKMPITQQARKTSCSWAVVLKFRNKTSHPYSMLLLPALPRLGAAGP